MRIAICDDEEMFARAMEKELIRIFAKKGLELQTVCVECRETLFAAMEKMSFDLLFMDIQLGADDGVELVREIRRQHDDLPVIFLTNMEHRVLDGYEVKAFYFLFKKEYQQKLPELMDRFLREYCFLNRITVKYHGSVRTVSVKDILWVESMQRLTLLHTTQEILYDAKAIGNFCQQLPEWLFVEAYHCLYVNLDHVSRVDTDSILMDNGDTVPISRRQRKTVLTAVMRRVAEK